MERCTGGWGPKRVPKFELKSELTEEHIALIGNRGLVWCQIGAAARRNCDAKAVSAKVHQRVPLYDPQCAETYSVTNRDMGS